MTALLAVTVVLVTGVGSDLPGPKIRERLGLVDKKRQSKPCVPSGDQDRTPDMPVPAAGGWRREAPLSLPRDELRAATVDGRIYLANGHDLKVRSISLFESYDPSTKRYRRAPDTPKPLDHAELVTYRGDLYLFGGNTNLKGAYAVAHPSGGLWRYSPSTRTWTGLAHMRLPRWGHSGAVIGDRLYVAGGVAVGEDQFVLPLEIYDFESDRWTFGPDLPTGRHHVSAAALDGKLYVAGGRNPTTFHETAFERYDPQRNEWKKLPPLPHGTGGPAVVAADGKVIVMGGGDDEEAWVTGAVWAFDPRTERWGRLPNLSVPRHGLTATIADGRIYAFGGAPCAGFGLSEDVESLPAR